MAEEDWIIAEKPEDAADSKLRGALYQLHPGAGRATVACQSADRVFVTASRLLKSRRFGSGVLKPEVTFTLSLSKGGYNSWF
jgi:hypothetical protein